MVVLFIIQERLSSFRVVFTFNISLNSFKQSAPISLPIQVPVSFTDSSAFSSNCSFSPSNLNSWNLSLAFRYSHQNSMFVYPGGSPVHYGFHHLYIDMSKIILYSYHSSQESLHHPSCNSQALYPCFLHLQNVITCITSSSHILNISFLLSVCIDLFC